MNKHNSKDYANLIQFKMKVATIRQLAIVLLFCQFLTSCYSYKSVVGKRDPETPLGFKITTGKIYIVELETGEERKMRIGKVDENYLYGTLYTDNPNGKTLEAPDTMLPLNQVADVKEKKSNPGLTVAAILVPASLLVYLAVTADYFGNFRMTL